MDEVILNKIATVQRCIGRIQQEFVDEAEFKQNFTKQDSVILNLQRACEACIDIANRLNRLKSLSLPQSARHSFTLLEESGAISGQLAEKLRRMVGLRNIAVHDYQTLNLDIVIAVVKSGLNDFTDFCQTVVVYVESDNVT